MRPTKPKVTWLNCQSSSRISIVGSTSGRVMFESFSDEMIDRGCLTAMLYSVRLKNGAAISASMNFLAVGVAVSMFAKFFIFFGFGACKILAFCNLTLAVTHKKC